VSSNTHQLGCLFLLFRTKRVMMTRLSYPSATNVRLLALGCAVRGLCALALVLWMAGALGRGLPAPAQRMPFDLPARPLAAALTAYGEATGLSVLVTADLTVNRQSAAVRGLFTPAEALRQLLAGSGLTARYASSTAFTLVPIDNTPSPARENAADPARQAGLYAARVQRVVGRLLCELQPDKLGRYRVGLQVWIDASGQIYRVHLLNSPGVTAWGGTVQAVITRQIIEPPPPGFQLPITLLLRDRQDTRGDCRRLQQ
jgi:hypothetical protein